MSEFSVKNYGAVGDGVTDDTYAINATIKAAGSVIPRGTVLFPRGMYKTTGNHDLSNLHGLKIRGEGIRTSQIVTNHPTNNIFTLRYGMVLTGFEMSDLTFTSCPITPQTSLGYSQQFYSIPAGSFQRVGGYVFSGGPNTWLNQFCKFQDLEIIGQANGIQVSNFHTISMVRINAFGWSAPGGVGVFLGDQNAKTSTGWGCFFDGCKINGSLAWDQHKTGLNYGVYGINVNSVHIDGSLILATRAADVQIGTLLPALDQCGEIFIGDTQFDSTGGCHIYIYNSYSISISNCQFYNTGLHSYEGWPKQGDATSGVIIAGSKNCSISNSFFNWATGTGLVLWCSTGTLSGCVFEDNGLGLVPGSSDAICVQQAAPNDPSWVITGCRDTHSHGWSLNTGTNTQRLVVVGNYFASKASFATPPLVNSGNYLGG